MATLADTSNCISAWTHFDQYHHEVHSDRHSGHSGNYRGYFLKSIMSFKDWDLGDVVEELRDIEKAIYETAMQEISLRDRFAMTVLPAIVHAAMRNHKPIDPDLFAESAYVYADEMMKARKIK